MVFKITVRGADNKATLFKTSNISDGFLQVLNSLEAALTNKINLLTNLQGINFTSESKKIIEAISNIENYPIKILDSDFPYGTIVHRKLSIETITTSPSIFSNLKEIDNLPENELGIVEITGKTIKSIGTIFNDKQVNMTCDEQLYIENNYFNGSSLIINGRMLTTQEVSHISKNILDKCPLNVSLTLYIDPNDITDKDDLEEYIAEQGEVFARDLAEHIQDAIEDRIKVVSIFNEYNEELANCVTDFVPKIINIPCSGVVAFDFLSI
jgi:hypothetical protein